MIKEELKNQINEAIASKNTSDSNRKLLIGVREELKNAENEKQYFSLALKLIELVGGLVKAFAIGSG